MTETHASETTETPVTLSHLVHTLRAYSAGIVLSLAVVAVAYILFASVAYLLSPSQTVTVQPFRLDFENAEAGAYPNGSKFSSSDIVAAPILLKVFNDNHLERYTTFPEFARSIFVLEANREYDMLAAEYQSRISDPKLSAIDRERIQRDFQAKAAAIAKNDLAVNYVRTRSDVLPESLARKVLTGILQEWARYASVEKHAVNYRLAVLSAQVITSGVDDDYVIEIELLRSKIYRVLADIDALSKVPSAELVRSRTGASLEEVRLRLEELVRFRLEPLMIRIRGAGLIKDPATTTRFLEAQLAYDMRQLKEQQNLAEAIRQSLAVYTNDPRSMQQPGAAAAVATAPRAGAPSNAPETLMPQLNETFIDRLMTLTSQSGDVVYRQKLADDYRRAAIASVPLERAVAYDQDVLAILKSGVGSASADAATVRNEITGTQNEVRQLLTSVNDIYLAISRNLNPSTELYTLTAPPSRRTERARNLGQLAVTGVAIMAFAAAVIVILAFLHARIRQEESAEKYTADDAATT